jgi:hypothetical protein
MFLTRRQIRFLINLGLIVTGEECETIYEFNNEFKPIIGCSNCKQRLGYLCNTGNGLCPPICNDGKFLGINLLTYWFAGLLVEGEECDVDSVGCSSCKTQRGMNLLMPFLYAYAFFVTSRICLYTQCLCSCLRWQYFRPWFQSHWRMRNFR